MEHCQPVILQAHLDMVPQTSNLTIDFSNDPIQALCLMAAGCALKVLTLGADNGISVAACLAVLTDPSLKHGPLEVLFTVDEGSRHGRVHLRYNLIGYGAKILINTDARRTRWRYLHGLRRWLRSKTLF